MAERTFGSMPDIAAADAGCLRLVPSMLEAWHAVHGIGNRELIGYAISDMLESRRTLRTGTESR